MRTRSSKFLGFAFIVLGAFLFLKHNNWFGFDDRFFRWYTFLILIGIFISVFSRKIYGGIALIAVGSVFAIKAFLGYDFLNIDLIPLVFVGIGMYLLLQAFGKGKFCIQANESSNSNCCSNEYAVFGGVKRIITDKNYKGGNVSSIFGGVQLDLRNAELDKGDQILNVSIVFGGMEIIVPQTMNVEIQVRSILGGFDDKRIFNASTIVNTESKLIIVGEAIFGGGVIKNT